MAKIELSTDGGETYAPAIDLDDVDSDLAGEMEELFGFTWLDFLQGIQSGSVKSQKAMIWLARRPTEPDLKPADIKYQMSKFATREDGAVPLPTGEDSALSVPGT